MKQQRRHSFAEASINTAVGFVLSNALWPLIQREILHEPYRVGQGLAVVTAFTALSVVRNYWVRRAFNALAPAKPRLPAWPREPTESPTLYFVDHEGDLACRHCHSYYLGGHFADCKYNRDFETDIRTVRQQRETQ